MRSWERACFLLLAVHPHVRRRAGLVRAEVLARASGTASWAGMPGVSERLTFPPAGRSAARNSQAPINLSVGLVVRRRSLAPTASSPLTHKGESGSGEVP